MRRQATSVDVWRTPRHDGYLTEWSISLCDDDGEITCLGGDDDVDAAWDEACEAADERHIPARLLQGESNTVIREHEPPTPSKEDVSSWETVASYVSTFPSDDGEGAADVEVQIGEAHGAWFVRTTDDAGGSDDADDTAYESEQEARAAAEELVTEAHEGNPGEDAEAYLSRKLDERAGEPSSDGEWCVYWSTVGDDSHAEDRYETSEQAAAACDRANAALAAAHPGGQLLCGYEVRHLVDGKWCPIAEIEEA